MKANRAQIEGALKGRGSDHRFYLLHGPDDAGSRGLAKLLATTMGEGSERVDLSGADLKTDPARLADEAASISLFGGHRYIIVDANGDEIAAAVEGLIEAPVAGNPVAIITGALKPASRLIKLALADPNALAFASYVPEGRDADRLVIEIGRQAGLSIRSDVAGRIAAATGGNRALMERELDKFAQFLDAAPERPCALDHDAVDALGAASEGGDLSRLVDSAVGGDLPALEAELLRLSSEGIEGIPLVRAMLRRMLLLARLRAEVDKGNSVAAVMTAQGKSLFWKEKSSVQQQLGRWRSDLLAKAASRLVETERQVKTPGALGPVAVDEELFAICRQAVRLK